MQSDQGARPRVYLAGPPYAEEYRRRAAALVEEAGWEPVDPMRRDFRGRTEGHETEIVKGDLADIESCNAVLAAFTSADEGTSMEAWYAHGLGKRVVVYTGGTPVHPWTAYIAHGVFADLEHAVEALSGGAEHGEIRSRHEQPRRPARDHR